MRVTSETQVQQAIRNLQSSYAQMTRLQNQIASGKRLNRPSDGPADMVHVLQNKAEDARLTTHFNTVRDGSFAIEAGVSAMREVSELLRHARDLTVEANNPAIGPSARQTLAQEIDVAIDDLLRMANQKLPDGSHLFAGTATGTTPFVIDATDSQGRPQHVSYRGSERNSEVLVGTAQTVDTLIAGSRVFQVRDRGATVYTGSTGAKAGPGTDSATGQGTLLVRHTLTSFTGSSRVAAGTSAATGDTIIGPAGAHVLTINDTSGTGAGGTVSLNGGPAVNFTNADANLKVTGPQGEVVYLNTTAIAAGFNGSVGISAGGTLSTDGGSTSVAIDFSGNQSVLNGGTGAVTNVDSASIRRAGTDQLDHPGTYDTFQLLIALRDDIRNTRGLSDTERSASLSRRLAELDRVNVGVVDAMGGQSVRAEYLAKWKDRIADMQLELRKTTDELESVDYSTAIVSLQQEQNLYQMSLALTARVNSLTLADFLR